MRVGMDDGHCRSSCTCIDAYALNVGTFSRKDSVVTRYLGPGIVCLRTWAFLKNGTYVNHFQH
jgi:hypothetical protein